MAADFYRIQARIKAFDFVGLFTQELMWNHFSSRPLHIPVDGVTYELSPVAQRGMAVFLCVAPSDARFPNYAARRKIETTVAKTAREHIIIFQDRKKTVQIWQWVRREAGKPSASREQIYYVGQSGEGVIQKLEAITFALEEESNVATTVAKVSTAFDVEKVTRRFYDAFKAEHDALLKFITGIPDSELKRWYASVMLNRLMFIYFIQKKRFIADDPDYLSNRLKESKQRGKDCFYRELLCRLFFDGFAKPPEQRSSEANQLLGTVPYLNGSLFVMHQIELRYGKDITIRDAAFEQLFAFFERYDWHLDDRPTRTGREINPDVLGYVFEKYINQKEMGAYYSKEDITSYICQSTIIPALLDRVQAACPAAFEGKHAVWRLVKAEPERYLHVSILWGVDRELPRHIEAGLSNLDARRDWNKSADHEYALPTETWREVIDRRSHISELRRKLGAGDICSVSDFITLNLDSRRFAEEIIATAEDPTLVRAFYDALIQLSVLDPACGSGAFLFAALNSLERLYDACLMRMQAFVDDVDREQSNLDRDAFSDFRATLAEMNDKSRHPSPRYFVLKSIILNNLYGVDIMEEATEICKLRLFLKLVAQIRPGDRIEPLPDIDFNIRAGNSLVGYSTYTEVEHAVTKMLDFDNAMARIAEKAANIQKTFDRFRRAQTQNAITSSDAIAADKADLQRQLGSLELELNGYLASQYGVKVHDKAALARWSKTYQPFHWFIEFYGILNGGGFDVVIGNPPYVEYSENSFVYRINPSDFKTFKCKNLYAYMYEQAKRLVRSDGVVGFIVQISSVSTPSMEPLAAEIQRAASVWVSNYATRPACLFEGVTMNLSILVSRGKSAPLSGSEVFSTKYQRWSPVSRPVLFDNLNFTKVVVPSLFAFSIPKLTGEYERAIYTKVKAQKATIERCLEPSKQSTSQEMFYRTAGGRYFKIFIDRPFGSESKSNKSKYLRKECSRYAIIAVLSSNLWWWYYTLHFDMYNCKDYMIFGFPFHYESCKKLEELAKLGKALVSSLLKNAELKTQSYASTGERRQLIFRPFLSKRIMDDIDRHLAAHYGLTNEELDFIVNYDIKYRAGALGNDGDN